MYFKFRTIAGIELNSIKRIIAELQQLRKDYFDAIDPVRADIGNYHIVAFHKFTFLYHQYLGRMLHVESMHTTTELIEKFQKLNSQNYKLNKDVKDKEELLMKEADKKAFFEMKNDLEELIYKKNFFSTLEKNIVKNNINADLKAFNEKIDELEFSGQKITRDNVLEMFTKWDRYLTMLTDVAHLEEDARQNAPNFIVDELKRLVSKDQNPGEDEMDLAADPMAKESISKIVENKERWKSGDPYREVDNIIQTSRAVADQGEIDEELMQKAAKAKEISQGVSGDGIVPTEHYDDETLKKIDGIIDKYKKYLEKGKPKSESESH